MIDLTEHGIVTPTNADESRIMLAHAMVDNSHANAARLLTSIPKYEVTGCIREHAYDALVLYDQDGAEHVIAVPSGFGAACALGEPNANTRLRRVLNAGWN